MRITKSSRQTFIRKIRQYVNSELDKHDSDNIAIYAPSLTSEDIDLLGRDFNVRREFLGYVRFEKKVS